VDFLVGIVLHFWLQHQLFAFVRQGNELVLRHDGFNDAAAANFYAKTVLGLQFWGDAMAGAAAVLFALMLASGAAAVMGLAWTLLRRERRWDKRRGGGDPRLAATAPLR
jgi:hypothetical protein